MRKYITYFRFEFIKHLQYRAAALAGISTQIFFGFIFISVFIAFFESGSGDIAMTLPQTVTYIWMGQALLQLTNQFFQDESLMKLVKSGDICYELIRPQEIYFMWYAKLIGKRTSNALMRFLPIILISWILPSQFRMILPPTPWAFLGFLIALFFGVLLVTCIIELYPIITLKTISEKGIVPIVITIAELFSGGVVPILYFPKFMQVISSYLPFQYVSDVPFRIYTGNIAFTELMPIVLIQIIWIIILMTLSIILLKKSLKRVVVQGG